MLASMPDADSAIHIDNVSVVRNGTTILRNVCWSLPAGDHAVILGPNGSGKTTLTRVVTAYEWPTTGDVYVLGNRLGTVDVARLRRDVQVVNPAARFGVNPNLSAIDAACTGYFASLSLYQQPTADQRDHARHLLQAVGLSHRIDHPFGLLSTGEQRRCLLARAMVVLPRVLILDEPTAGLDIAGREHLLATIDRLHRIDRGPTVITVTHHVEEISPRTDRVLMLSEGAVLADGPPAKVIDPELLSRLFGCKVYVQRRSGRWWLEVLPEAWLDLLR